MESWIAFNLDLPEVVLIFLVYQVLQDLVRGVEKDVVDQGFVLWVYLMRRENYKHKIIRRWLLTFDVYPPGWQLLSKLHEFPHIVGLGILVQQPLSLCIIQLLLIGEVLQLLILS